MTRSVLWAPPLSGAATHDLPGETIPALFWNGVAARGERVFLREKKWGIWQSWTWQQVGAAVGEMAAGLLDLGLAPHDVVGILSNTRLEWLLADLAIQSAGGTANGIYPTDAPSQVQYLCEDSRTTVIFVEDDEQLDKVLEVRGRLPMLRWIVVFDTRGLERFDDPMVLGLDRLRERGRGGLGRGARLERFQTKCTVVIDSSNRDLCF